MAIIVKAGARRSPYISLSEASIAARWRGKIFLLGIVVSVTFVIYLIFAFSWTPQHTLSNASLVRPPELPGDRATAFNPNLEPDITGNTVARYADSTSSADGNKSDDSDSRMPSWMKDYFAWHAAERQRLDKNRDKWTSVRFLMMQCLPGSRKCGGTADRLKPLPLMLWAAHRSKRLLLIKWGRPAELEAFLLPPQGGMDWRVPDWLFDIKEFRQGPRATNVEELVDLTKNQELNMVKARVQSHDHGLSFYNEQRQGHEPTFQDVYHVCWRLMFTPSPPIAKLIERQMLETGLVPGQYVGIHIRALYAVSERDPGMVQHWTHNAVNCASQLQSGGPFYISSDSSYAVTVGREYGHARDVLVASRSITESNEGHTEPFHLDKAPRSVKPSDFYDTFVDLYLLALSRCVTYNMGGYGTWALLISPYANDKRFQNSESNGACSMQHHDASGIHKCDWLKPGNGGTKGLPATVKPATTTSLFDPPMS